MRNNRTSRGLQNGFSLIEVLVATTVGTAVILMMTMTMRVGTDGFNEATRRVDALVEARAALGVLSDDVSTMVGVANDEFGWLSDDDRFHEIYFLTLKPLEAQDSAKAVGDVCFVHYFTAVTQDGPASEAKFSRKLYRRFVSSGDLVQRLRSGQLPVADADPDSAEAVAFNVTRFTAQPLTQGGDLPGLTEWSQQTGGLPQALKIDFQVVDSDTAGLMQKQQDWTLDTQLARTLILEGNDGSESSRGRDFQLNLEIGHAN